MMVVGSSECGKTLLVANLLTRSEMPWSLANRGYAKKWLLVPPNKQYDNDISRVPGFDVLVYSEEAVSQIIEEAGRIKGKKLLIIDDPAQAVRYNGKNSDAEAIWNMGRHLGFSTILICQRYVQYPPAARTNLTHILAFALPNGNDIKNFCGEFTRMKLTKFEILHDWYHKLAPHNYFILVNSNGWQIYDRKFNSLDGTTQKLAGEAQSLSPPPRKKIRGW